jgi:hypothetical protein
MSRESFYGFPTADIRYPIEPNRRTAWHKLISLNDYPPNTQFTQLTSSADIRYSIVWMYERARQNTDRIFIECMNVSAGLPTEYLLSVWMGQADTEQIFIGSMNVLGGLLTEYLFNVWVGQADYRPNEYSFDVWMCQPDYRPNIYWVYEWVRRIRNGYSLAVWMC